jgi:hypothetical protein
MDEHASSDLVKTGKIRRLIGQNLLTTLVSAAFAKSEGRILRIYIDSPAPLGMMCFTGQEPRGCGVARCSP